MEGAATQRVPEYCVVLQTADGGAWWYAVVSGFFHDSALLLSLGRRRSALWLVAAVDVAHETGILHSAEMDGTAIGSSGYPAVGQYGLGLLGLRYQVAWLLLCAHAGCNRSGILVLDVSFVA